MIGKLLRLILLLIVAGGVPYAWFSDTFSQGLRGKMKQWLPSKSTGSMFGGTAWRSSVAAAIPSSEPPPQPASASEKIGKLPEITASPIVEDPFANVLRMDITHDWVISRWPRVSTVRSQQHLLGMRVTYVSGTRFDDVSGSLTYYFDDFGRVRRISMHGYTGDFRRLLSVTSELFQVRHEPNLRAGLYVARWNAKPTNVLWITHAPVVRAEEPHWRYEVRLEINRADSHYSLSSEFAELLSPEYRPRQ